MRYTLVTLSVCVALSMFSLSADAQTTDDVLENVKSKQSNAWKCEAIKLLFLKDSMTLDDRKAFARCLLERVTKFNYTIPTLSPSSQKWLDKEFDLFAKGVLGKGRADALLQSKEMLISGIRKASEPLQETLDTIVNNKKINEQGRHVLWIYVIYLLTDRVLTNDAEILQSRGIIQLDDWFDDTGTALFGRFIIQKIILPYAIRQQDKQ